VSRDKSAQISPPQPGHMWAGSARGAHCVPATSGGYVNLRSSMYATAAAVQAYSTHILSRKNLQPLLYVRIRHSMRLTWTSELQYSSQLKGRTDRDCTRSMHHEHCLSCC
jgi:hypothetical protein